MNVDLIESKRVKNDYYPTDLNIFRGLLEKCPFIDPEMRIFDPCAGDGRLRKVCLNLGTNEPYPFQSFEPDYRLDASDRNSWERFGQIDWTITNPPYKGELPNRIIENAWNYSDKGAAFLMRLTYIEPVKKRRELLAGLKDHLRMVIPINPRGMYLVSSGKTSTDNCCSVWLVFQKDWSWKEQVGFHPLDFILDWR